jgi:carboxymethylenebutenolidase
VFGQNPGLYGGDDARVTSTIAATEATMKELDRPFTARVFPGAGHGSLRQQSGRDGANLKAAVSAWRETIEFLRARTG